MESAAKSLKNEFSFKKEEIETIDFSLYKKESSDLAK
jgi:hypothetical protein